MRISVVIPVYNRREQLAAALRSVVAQSEPPEEIIVVDDGSTDGDAATLPLRFPQVEIIALPHNRGVSAARNVGIRRARGEWIALLDSDDEWLPRKLERQRIALERQPEQRLCHTDEIWMRRGVRVNPMKKHAKRGGRILLHCLPRCCISPSSALIHRSVFDELGLFDETLPACEDYDYWLRFCARYPALYVDEPLVRKRGGHADQLSRSVPGLDRFRIRALEKLLQSDAPLTAEERAAATATLREKCRIYADGARKRGRIDEAQRYEARLE